MIIALVFALKSKFLLKNEKVWFYLYYFRGYIVLPHSGRTLNFTRTVL